MGHKQIYGKNKDAVKAGLNFDSVKSVTIPYLSFSIQRKIVAKLDAVRAWCDKIKRAAEEGVKTTTRLRKAILKEAFE